MTPIIRTNKGFGIAETLIASMIVAIIIFALTAAGRSALKSTIYMHERAQASYLAQEGLELLRQIRDTNWIDSSSATGFGELTGYIGATKVIYFDGTSTPRKYRLATQTASNDIVVLDGVNFHRTITFAQIAKDQAAGLLPTNSASNDVEADINSVKATVTITWNNNGRDRQVSASEILTNWRPNY